jgi:hypothetical protein
MRGRGNRRGRRSDTFISIRITSTLFGIQTMRGRGREKERGSNTFTFNRVLLP